MENEDKRIKVEDGQVFVRRSLVKPEDGSTVCDRLIDENRERNIKNSEVWKQYNGAQPFSPVDIKAAGQGWRSNRSTGFMPNIVQRSFPPYLAIWEGGKHVTSSTLTSQGPESEQKNMIFREEITKLVRRWGGWKNLAYLVVCENTLIGYTACCIPDSSEWKPIALRNDYVYLPDNCPQDAENVPLFVMKHDFMIHELAEKIQDPDIAQQVGWNVENVIDAINEAKPKNRQEATIEGAREYQDMVREMSIGMSYAQGVNVIETKQLFIREPDGKVSHFIYHARSNKVLYANYNKFEKMNDCLVLFTIEIGNGNYYGSKGAGRILYNTHIVAEQARNLIQDNLYLSGMLLLTKKSQTDEPAVRIMHPMAIVDSNYAVESAGFEVNTDAFFQLDRHMQSIAEMQVGVFMPAQMLNGEGGKRSASEVKYVASIEQEIRDGLLSRHAAQFYKLIHMIQKRVCSEDNILAAKMILDREAETGVAFANPKINKFRNILGMSEGALPEGDLQVELPNQDAIDCILAMLRQGLTAIDVYELGLCDPSLSTEDPANNPEAIDAVQAKYIGHPNIRQTELIKRDISSKLGYNVAEELIIPEEDNTITSESTRLQIIELQSIMAGESIPVSPRDNDKIHMNIIIQKSKPVMEGLMQGGATEETLTILGNVLSHFEEHINGARAKGMQDDQLADEINFFTTSQQMLQQALEMVKSAPQSGLMTEAQPAALSAVQQ